ncbi:unnamed protein product [Rotaria sp. Silwood2]|nr:unnamed protein product [Rotaria sp. Silwood2]CAF2795096.1 unnamed protein product [Rotaria sp. Silwood2]CAF3402483.1 unnamed protein product [Rotaria sp. Silwood2]CAF4133769.1 unnamed protein product [Rotaria sp. Silwood2]CAF4244127.1 unnamed protein product [Rotaria sp. Silwood2]
MINESGKNYSFTSLGRANQCLTLSGTLSYVQITGLKRLGTNSWPYTLAIWIYPTNVLGGTIVQLSSRTDGEYDGSSWTAPLIGFTSSGQIAINSWDRGDVPINGPTVPLLAWTHVAATYSLNNGERLYINGTQYGSASDAFAFLASGVSMTITLGSSIAGTDTGATGTVLKGQYQGSLDEFRVYARELTAVEVAALANP